MGEPHTILNGLDAQQAGAALRRACGAEGWIARMLARRPFASTAELYASAALEWSVSTREDYLEAFGHHPQIGEDLGELRRRFQNTANLSSREQAGMDVADDATLRALCAANAAYRERFGYIFIICATGKSAGEMLAALRQRLDNEPNTELRIAAGEHAKITELRLAGLGS
jgi:2-oxo-4-hydroxy-4-carboxy-5-ureidoimidazoline decarboxylase